MQKDFHNLCWVISSVSLHFYLSKSRKVSSLEILSAKKSIHFFTPLHFAEGNAVPPCIKSAFSKDSFKVILEGHVVKQVEMLSVYQSKLVVKYSFAISVHRHKSVFSDNTTLVDNLVKIVIYLVKVDKLCENSCQGCIEWNTYEEVFFIKV